MEKSARAAFLIAFYVCTRNFIKFTEFHFRKYYCRLFSVNFPSIWMKFYMEVLNPHRLTWVFLIVIKIFRQFSWIGKFSNFFLWNSSRAAYLSRFPLSIRNFMRFSGKQTFATAFAVFPSTSPSTKYQINFGYCLMRWFMERKMQ